MNDELDTVDDLDVERFMGKWYVIAPIPRGYDRSQLREVPQQPEAKREEPEAGSL